MAEDDVVMYFMLYERVDVIEAAATGVSSSKSGKSI